MGCSIRMFAHCRNCAPQKPRQQSMNEWARLSAGLTDSGLQLWCNRCQLEVFHFIVEELTQQLENARCECCPGGVHVN